MPQPTTASPAGHEGDVLAILERAGTDRAFRSRLLEHPAKTLRAGGVPTRDGVELRPVDAGPGTFHLILPPVPVEGELSDGDLAEASGGITIFSFVYTIVLWNGGVFD
jgi:hypothetical protein